MSDINLNLNLLTKRYEASTRSVVSTSKKMTSQVLSDASKLQSGLKSVNRSFSQVEKPVFSVRNRLKEFSAETNKSSSAFASLGKTALAGFGVFSLVSGAINGLTSAVRNSARNYLELENAQIAVAKTTTLTNDEIEQLTSTFRSLSSRIPTSVNELLNLGSVAGQLGVDGVDNIALFSETISKLNSATDLAGEEGARSLIRVLNVTGQGAQDIDNLASAIVDLGNNFAATESEITRVATEVARSTSQFNIGSANVAGISTALKALGIQAQLGGSVVGKAFRTINSAVQSGGKTLNQFAKLAGVSSQVFVDTFNADATQGFRLFIEGLGNLDASEISTQLERLGLSGDEVNKVLPVLAQRADLVGSAIERSNKAFRENTALNEEAERAYGSLSNQLTVLGNNFTNIGVLIASQFAPALENAVKLGNRFFSLFDNLQGIDKLRQELQGVESEIERLNDQTQTPFSFAADTTELERQRDVLRENIREYNELNNISSNPISIEGQLNQELSRLQEQLNLTKIGFDTTFGANPNREEQITQEINRVKEKLKELNTPDQEQENSVVEKSKEQAQALLEIERAKQNELAILEATRREERNELEASELERLQQLEQRKLEIIRNFNLEKAKEEQDQSKRTLAIQKVNADFEVQQRALTIKQEKELTKIQEEQDKQRVNNRRSTLGTIASLSLSSNRTLASIGKAAAITTATQDGIVAVQKALASAPPPFNFALAALVGAATAANVARIANIGSFETGGVISGTSNTGDRLTANVNSGEMILNKRQQTQLFNQANGSGGGYGLNADNIRQIVAETVSSMNVTLVADDNEIARSTSRGVSNGIVIGVSQ